MYVTISQNSAKEVQFGPQRHRFCRGSSAGPFFTAWENPVDANFVIGGSVDSAEALGDPGENVRQPSGAAFFWVPHLQILMECSERRLKHQHNTNLLPGICNQKRVDVEIWWDIWKNDEKCLSHQPFFGNTWCAEGLRDFSDAPSFALTACFARGGPPRKRRDKYDDEEENIDGHPEYQTFDEMASHSYPNAMHLHAFTFASNPTNTTKWLQESYASAKEPFQFTHMITSLNFVHSPSP